MDIHVYICYDIRNRHESFVPYTIISKPPSGVRKLGRDSTRVSVPTMSLNATDRHMCMSMYACVIVFIYIYIHTRLSLSLSLSPLSLSLSSVYVFECSLFSTGSLEVERQARLCRHSQESESKEGQLR